MGQKTPVHYRIPLRLISSGDWAQISLAAKAVLPVIGVFANRTGIAWPGLKTICRLSGYKKHETVQKGIKSLEQTGLLVKKKRGRHNVYSLVGNAIWRGHSYFPMYKDVIEEGYWAGLLACEKSVFLVLALKATINYPELRYNEDPLVHAMGTLLSKNKYIELSGVSKNSFYNAISGLSDKSWIDLTEENEYTVYCKPDF